MEESGFERVDRSSAASAIRLGRIRLCDVIANCTEQSSNWIFRAAQHDIRRNTEGDGVCVSRRHVVLFGIAGASLVARGVTTVVRGFPAKSVLPMPDPHADSATGSGKELVNAIALAAVVICILLVGWGVISPAAQQTAMERKYPTALVATLEKISTPGDRLFNEYRWGGFLIANSTVPVFIDGRSELYGDEQLDRYASIIRMKPGWDQRLDSLRVTSVLMPVSAPLPMELSRRGWYTAARDSVGWLLTRKR